MTYIIQLFKLNHICNTLKNESENPLDSYLTKIGLTLILSIPKIHFSHLKINFTLSKTKRSISHLIFAYFKKSNVIEAHLIRRWGPTFPWKVVNIQNCCW